MDKQVHVFQNTSIYITSLGAILFHMSNASSFFNYYYLFASSDMCNNFTSHVFSIYSPVCGSIGVLIFEITSCAEERKGKEIAY